MLLLGGVGVFSIKEEAHNQGEAQLSDLRKWSGEI
jgi:hypothetical protein